MKSFTGKIIGVTLLASIACGINAQSLDQAKKLYNDGQYEEAKPAFEKLVNQSPSNASYNLWYGVCCYETGDLANAEGPLLVANKRKVADSYRYLAYLYTRTYQFDLAATQWEDYITLMNKKREDTEAYEEQLKRVETMIRMKEKTEAVQVIDSMVVSKDRILSTYFLSEDNGKLLPYDEIFSTNAEEASPVYVSPKDDQAYYGRMENGRSSLFMQSKLLDNWADEKEIFSSDSVDNNYPFVLGDGVTLYFASQGNESIGGYDLFITRYNTNTNSYLAPEQLGMPFNSPANDYMMVIDEAKGVGWFVSDRNQPAGKVCVYLFIPDESRQRVAEGMDDAKLCSIASLKSIRDTWAEGSDYTAQIRLAKTDASATEKKVEKEIEFIVNDKTTYYTWKEIRSNEARQFYEKVVDLQKQAKSLKNKLNEAYLSYSKGSVSVQDKLKSSILEDEQTLSNLYVQVKDWEKKARNAENNALK